MSKHGVFGPAVIDPPGPRLKVHLTELPPLDGMFDSVHKSTFLFDIAHREPELDQDDAGTDEHALEIRTGHQELVVFFVGAETHNLLDAGAVVPTPIKKDHFTGGGQVGDIPLEVPLRAFSFGWLCECDNPHRTRVGPLENAFYRTSLASSVSAFEDHTHLEALVTYVTLQLHQFALQTQQLRFVDVLDSRLLTA